MALRANMYTPTNQRPSNHHEYRNNRPSSHSPSKSTRRFVELWHYLQRGTVALLCEIKYPLLISCGVTHHDPLLQPPTILFLSGISSSSESIFMPTLRKFIVKFPRLFLTQVRVDPGNRVLGGVNSQSQVPASVLSTRLHSNRSADLCSDNTYSAKGMILCPPPSGAS